MFGNRSIRPTMVVLLAVPLAGTALLGLAGAAPSRGDRARAAEHRRRPPVRRPALDPDAGADELTFHLAPAPPSTPQPA